MVHVCAIQITKWGGRVKTANLMDAQEKMGTVMEMVFVTPIPGNASVIHCGLDLTVGQQIVRVTRLVLVRAVVMLLRDLVDVTVIETGLGKLVTYLVCTE